MGKSAKIARNKARKATLKDEEHRSLMTELDSLDGNRVCSVGGSLVPAKFLKEYYKKY